MDVKHPDKINFACSLCETEFSVDTARVAAEQEIVCPNCLHRFDLSKTKAIGKAVRNLFAIVPTNFSWWLN
ncbi:MAG: MJ0042-type zinc finger domain-containing protein [Thermodesulfobacteriota bacterium]|nr:MJ0042-type zinc finger domain-containing protein [Thermodesulfobacteriota bacterium]